MPAPHKRWNLIVAGDLVRLRPKRITGPLVDVTAATLLEVDRADGRGFVDEAGTTYRAYYYDLVAVLPPPAP